MLALTFGIVLSLQVAQPAKRPPTFVRDSSVADSTTRRAPKRLPVTAALLASAFRDEGARVLFRRAHAARMAQDSSLRSYDANVRQRISVGIGIGSLGPQRVMYRQESASRVRWQQGVGARIELTGARMALPIAPKEDERNEFLENIAAGNYSTVPYFPGYEALWIGGRAQDDVDDRGLVNPLANGAEAYYTYESGDSIRSTLPDGRVVRLLELRVRPRAPESNLAVGSLTFEVESGQLVWAAYRLAAPRDMWVAMQRRADTALNSAGMKIVKAIAPEVKSQISEVTIEYSLHGGRFWLPRSRSMKGFSQIGAVKLPVSVEHSYRYESVNGGETIGAIALNTGTMFDRVEVPDSLTGEAANRWRDSVRKTNRLAREALRDSIANGPCDSTGTRTVARTRYDGQLAIATTFPCNVDKLVASSEFTGSIYDANDEVFGSADRQALVAHALSLAAQAPLDLLGLSPARLQYGMSMTRFNRVEGLSTGLLVEQQLGGGYTASAVGRLGTADREPNVELSLARSDLTRTLTLTGYNRLVSANDWGRPLSFSASVSALLFGRDEGFYYRATGADLAWRHEAVPGLEWRLFAEQQRTARMETDFSFGAGPGPNVAGLRGTSVGASARLVNTLGLDPRGFRLFSDIRLEGSGGDFRYGRAAGDITLSRTLFADVAAGVTIAAGSSVGTLPPQRHWFLGGVQTIRGQSADVTQSGNAFWLARSEIGRDFRAYRVSAFGDVGWVGDRTKLSEVGRPLSGVGVGLSVMDGLARIDLARGIYPRQQTRLDLSLGARW